MAHLLEHILDVEGRSDRRAYISVLAVIYACVFAAVICDELFVSPKVTFLNLGEIGLTSLCVFILTLVPSLIVSIRRIHDIGFSASWWFVLCFVIPVSSLILMLILASVSGQKHANRFGGGCAAREVEAKSKESLFEVSNEDSETPVTAKEGSNQRADFLGRTDRLSFIVLVVISGALLAAPLFELVKVVRQAENVSDDTRVVYQAENVSDVFRQVYYEGIFFCFNGQTTDEDISAQLGSLAEEAKRLGQRQVNVSCPGWGSQRDTEDLAPVIQEWLAQSSSTPRSPPEPNDPTLIAALALAALCGVLISVYAFVRRLHDLGVSGYWALAAIGPQFVVMAMVLAILPGDMARNRFGSPPTGLWGNINSVFRTVAIGRRNASRQVERRAAARLSLLGAVIALLGWYLRTDIGYETFVSLLDIIWRVSGVQIEPFDTGHLVLAGGLVAAWGVYRWVTAPEALSPAPEQLPPR